jgi:poly(A) polymerase
MSDGDPSGPRQAAAAFAELCREPVVGALLAASGATECHLVGGVLRDCALGLVTHDIDAVVAGRGREIAGELAGRLPARLVLLGGRDFAAYRLVLGGAAGRGGPEGRGERGERGSTAERGYTPESGETGERADGDEQDRHGVLDLWDRQSTPLHDDLARRDFTVNAFALDPRNGEVIDPFGGLADLDRRSLRATTSESFEGDPLRVLRLARLLVWLPGFGVEPATRNLARRATGRVTEMAAERIREELRLLFSHRDAGRGLLELAALDLYPALWLGHPGDAAARSLPGTGAAASREGAGDRSEGAAAIEQAAVEREAVEQAAAEPVPAEPAPTERAAAEIAVLPACAGELRHWLGIGAAARGAAAGGAIAVADSLPPIDFTAARFAATFRQLPAPVLSRMRDAGYVSVRQATEIAPLLAAPAELPAPEVDRRRFIHRYGRRWLTVATSCGGAAAAAGPEALDRWRRAAGPLCELARREGAALIAPPRLLDGEDVQRLLEIPAGPQVGAALAALTAAQVDGTVRTREQAESFLRRWQRSTTR